VVVPGALYSIPSVFTPSHPLTPTLVAADVRRLILFSAKEVRASLRRLLQFRGSMCEYFGEISPR